MHKLTGINIVIASGSPLIQNCLQEAFEGFGAVICLCDYLDLDFVDRLEAISEQADVILIDMDDSYAENDEALDRLLERIDLPILFHDNDFDAVEDPLQECRFAESALDKLASKLAKLAQNKPLVLKKAPDKENNPSTAASLDGYQEVEFTVDDLSRNTQALPAQNEQHAENVWVLGASIGGPEALKRFLSRIPVELPVAFILAQHLGEGFVPLLATQLDRVSCFKVKEAQDGEVLKHGEVIIVPIEHRMNLIGKGQIQFLEEKWEGHYKPCIDAVINEAFNCYKERAGVIIFSGMGTDGVLASQQFAAQYQGNIWAQDPESCVVSSMPDSVRKANLVSYSGSPEALALKIAMQYMGKDSYINLNKPGGSYEPE